MGDLTDDELMLLFCDGDAEAFEELFSRHRLSVYNFAHTMLNDSEGAEDVLQEAFLAVAHAAKSYEPRGQFRTWLMRIVRNRCLNCIESDRLRRMVLSQSDPDIIYPSAASPPIPDQIEMSEQLQLIRRAITQLPHRQRETIVLYAFEQMSYRQISDVLDTPENTVKTLIHRARAALAKALNDGQEETSHDV